MATKEADVIIADLSWHNLTVSPQATSFMPYQLFIAGASIELMQLMLGGNAAKRAAHFSSVSASLRAAKNSAKELTAETPFLLAHNKVYVDGLELELANIKFFEQRIKSISPVYLDLIRAKFDLL